MQKISILGSTGSIGVNTLDVIARHPERYQVIALCAHTQVDKLFDQCLEFRPRFAVLRDQALAEKLAEKLAQAGSRTEVSYGEKALVRMAERPEVDVIMAAIVGAAGLASTMAAAKAGKKILLANKEALVMAGPIFMRAVHENGACLLPIDSEHNAIFQSLPRDYSGDCQKSGIEGVLLTASGGPFLNLPQADFAKISPKEACAHPNWVMGRKISVDSATMMNKGLEMIEACWLFNLLPEQITVVIHPQSVIHSLVRYVDGSVIAELGNPDMRTPIAHALAFPERIASGVAPLDLFNIATLNFSKPDVERFPCLALAYRAFKQGGSASTALNAANEVAVDAFLEGRIGFLQIPATIAEVMRQQAVRPLDSLDDVFIADQEARQCAKNLVDKDFAR